MNNIKKVSIILIIVCLFFSCSSKETRKEPYLIVGVVIDQMRAEYLYRFHNNYGEDGFKRLMREGFNVKNTHYNYVPTATGPGHSSIYTGTTPANHGIVSNDWYSNNLEKTVYCAEDTTSFLIDGNQVNRVVNSFSRSPKKLLTSTITDELKLFSNGRSKVIGLSLKDRGAIFPSGHMADGAYWYNGNNGSFITSSYYKDQLPIWLKEFNAKKIADSLLNLTWKTLLPMKAYINSGPDKVDFEKVYKGRNESTFPYNLKELRKENDNYKLIYEVPQGNTLLTELVKATIIGEHLGQSKEVDFLTISYSSTDYIGHHFGIRSKELEDTYIRLDRELATLLNALDKEVGKGNYILFLTADHAASDTPGFLKVNRLPGKFYNSQKIQENLNTYLSSMFGNNSYIAYMDKTQIYFFNSEIPKEKLIEESLKLIKHIPGIQEIYVPEFPKYNMGSTTMETIVKNSYNPMQSGDIIYHTQSGWMEEREFGTTHGSGYNSDTHVPLLWFGNNIENGETVKKINITQIAPTLSFLLDIPIPSASDRNPIEELFVKKNNE